MKHGIFSIMAVALVLSISAPASAQNGNKSILGLLLGAAGGGFTGSQFGSGSGQLVFTALGTLFGAGAGQSIGGSLDRADTLFTTRQRRISRYDPRYNPQYDPRINSRRYDPRIDTRRYQYRRYNENNISQPYRRQPDTYATNRYNGNRSSGCSSNYVREYQTVINVGGREVPAWGQACYMADGSWRPIGGLNFQ